MQQKGLQKIIDLGEYWEKETGNPDSTWVVLLLKEIDVQDVQKKIDELIRKSIEYAFSNYPDIK